MRLPGLAPSIVFPALLAFCLAAASARAQTIPLGVGSRPPEPPRHEAAPPPAFFEGEGLPLEVEASVAAPVRPQAIVPGGPVGTDDTYRALADSTLSIAAPGFLANDIDLGGEALTATAILDNADHGTLSAFADGSFNYTPDAGFVGTDAFVYRMRDASNNLSDSVFVAINVFNSDGELPVELVTFTARVADEASVLLNWETASETNNAGFEVEHKAPGATAFASVAYVKGRGTTSQPQQYRYRVTEVIFSSPAGCY